MPTPKLSPMEVELAAYFVTNRKSNKEIALHLGTSEASVKFHMRQLFKKLNAPNRVELAITLQKEMQNVNRG